METLLQLLYFNNQWQFVLVFYDSSDGPLCKIHISIFFKSNGWSRFLTGKWLFGIGILVTSVFTLLTPLAANTSIYLLYAVR
jgi:hypothetical protein